MNEVKFTRGEWRCVTHDGDVKHAVIYVNGGGFDISNCPDSVANAHLIAAAPEMYDLLNALEAECNMFYEEFGEPSNGEYGARFVDIKGLLAKARGEQNA